METISAPWGQLEGWSSGHGEPVLLIHGSGMADSFRCIEGHPAVAAYRLLSYHRRGYGGSSAHDGRFSIQQQAEDARAVLAHFALDRAHVVGHSYGGVTALQLALDDPDAVQSLALLEPAIMSLPAAADLVAGFQPVVALYEAGDRVGASAAFVEAVSGPDFRAVLDETLPAGWFDQLVTDCSALFDVEVVALETWRFGPDEVAQVQAPTLVVMGADTNELGKQSCAWLREHVPEAEVFTLPAANHLLQQMNPAGMAVALGAFLSRHAM